MKRLFVVGITLALGIITAEMRVLLEILQKGKPHMRFVLPVMEQTVWEIKL